MCRRLQVLWTQVLFRYTYHEHLLAFWDLPFNSLTVYLHEQKLLLLTKSNSQIFHLWLVLFISCLGNLNLLSSWWRYFPIVPSSIFTLLPLILKVYNLLQINFCVWCETRFIFPPLKTGNCSSTIFTEKATFSTELQEHFCCKSEWLYRCESFSGFYSALIIYLLV